MNEHTHVCHHEGAGEKKRLWYQDPLVLTLIGTATLLGLSYIFSFLEKFRISFFEYVRIIWLPIVIGFVVGGLVDHYIPRQYISKYFAGKTKRTIVYATGLGFLASACSHGVMALSMELHKKGASGPAVVSFLLASPWANLPVTFLLFGFFGFKGFLIIIAALFVSLVTGIIFQFLDQKGLIEHNRHSVQVASDFSIRKDFSARFKHYRFGGISLWNDVKGIAKGTYVLADMVLWWILIGMVLASLISAFVPSSIFHRFLGPTALGLLVTMGVAAVLEICSEGTAPLAFEIYRQSGAFGNTFAFLMGGVITDYTEIGLVWINLGRRTALWLLGVTIPQVLLLGWVFNMFF